MGENLRRPLQEFDKGKTQLAKIQKQNFRKIWVKGLLKSLMLLLKN
jgi:hypothetical protein